MDIVCLVLSACSLVLGVIILITILKKKSSNSAISDTDVKKIKESVNDSLINLNKTVSELVAEKNNALMLQVDKKIDELTNSQKELSQNVLTNNEKTSKTLNEFITQYTKDSSRQKDEIMEKISSEIKSFNEQVKKTLDEFNKSIKEKLEEFKTNTGDSINKLNETVGKQFAEIREDNNKKLDKINDTVNEKLQKTLEEKLETSFKSVVEGIGDVNKAVGEIKGLATDVGSLKNVLTNVKTKGIMGEVVLGNIIKEFLVSEQFEENIVTKVGSTERVEFAIKLPGTKDETIYLPVDSKFPYEPYSIITQSSDIEEINKAKKLLRANLLAYAKDVSSKYIDVPNTTDFAIIFLPLEGLYLEALNMGLFEEIQSKYKVNLTGPTTFTAFINSLNMGFRSLMIQKKSADVFKTLGAVKTEFNKFASSLKATQDKLDKASDELDKLVGTRTRMLNAKLREIEALDEESSKLLLEGSTEADKE